ncbi:hypothetical protein ESP51_06140 [Agromyces albus]|uniref:Uncharacterized protein n=1 Tax=Agromyces albus TaxID=205332 RepID=A0A4Q2L3C1_9MICO|nr:hypothetical protein ESP51_06140 [Agromyces albus]
MAVLVATVADAGMTGRRAAIGAIAMEAARTVVSRSLFFIPRGFWDQVGERRSVPLLVADVGASRWG